MGNLFANLNASANALAAFQRSLSVAQNNVSNASTAGYAKQLPTLNALPFDMQNGMLGGVQSGNPQSTRDEFLEQGVRYQAGLLGNYQAQAQSLSGLEPIFDVTGQSGILASLNSLFQSFSNWSANPDSAAARQDVLAKAQDLGASFQQTMSVLSSASDSIDNKISSTVSEINSLASQVLAYNQRQAAGGAADAGLDAHLHETLESLSSDAGITARFESDGSITLLLGGQTPLVIGQRQYPLSVSNFDTGTPVNANARPAAHILDASGQDVTAHVSSGTLSGLLTVRNSVLPGLQGDSQQAGAINLIAKKVADRVNQLLATGLTPGGQPGIALFNYNGSSAVMAARSLTVNPNITTNTLAAMDPGPPLVANGIAMALAGLGQSKAATDTINGQSIQDFLNGQTQILGQQSATAAANQSVARQAVTQAQALRAQVSGVSLDEEAIRVMELQRGYQSMSKMISVINGLADTLMQMV
jgi:flagellar hook-associated protein 1 FlgK